MKHIIEAVKNPHHSPEKAGVKPRAANTFVQDEEAVPCPIDTYMQIKRLEKIYVPMNMAYEETQDIQEMLET